MSDRSEESAEEGDLQINEHGEIECYTDTSATTWTVGEWAQVVRGEGEGGSGDEARTHPPAGRALSRVDDPGSAAPLFRPVDLPFVGVDYGDLKLRGAGYSGLMDEINQRLMAGIVAELKARASLLGVPVLAVGPSRANYDAEAGRFTVTQPVKYLTGEFMVDAEDFVTSELTEPVVRILKSRAPPSERFTEPNGAWASRRRGGGGPPGGGEALWPPPKDPTFMDGIVRKLVDPSEEERLERVEMRSPSFTDRAAMLGFARGPDESDAEFRTRILTLLGPGDP